MNMSPIINTKLTTIAFSASFLVLLFAADSADAIDQQRKSFDRLVRGEKNTQRRALKSGKGGTCPSKSAAASPGELADRYQVFDLTSPFVTNRPGTYAGMEQFCADQGMRLCTLEELCPYRPAIPSQLGFMPCQTTPPFHAVDEDMWVAYMPEEDDTCLDPNRANCGGLTNTWVQIGNRNGNELETCQKHCEETVPECPTWGLMSGAGAYQRLTVCCGC